jgi:prevent-host-death family protein
VKTVSAAEANRNFSKLLGRVDKGERITITSRGRPVAVLVPAGDDADEAARKERARKRLVDSLRNRPILNLPRVTRDEIYDYLD